MLPPGASGTGGRAAAGALTAADLSTQRLDAVVSCLASRNGAPDDAWAVDHRAHQRAFETELQDSGLAWTVVRPTALVKSLSGQLQRVRQGEPFLVFGDGRLTACTAIADEDLADCLADHYAALLRGEHAVV